MPRLAYTLSLLLLSATAVAPKTAVAVPVTDFVTIQPIDVCATATQGCAPINNLTNPVTHQAGQTVLSNPGTVQIGFIDTSTGSNVTNAIWNQIGISVTFLPVVQDVNPAATTISVTSCAANGTDCQSPAFETLSDQSSISAGNAPSPSPPLSANPTTINMFFINKLTPPSSQPGTLFGLSWVNANGIAIASNALVGAGARVDTVGHEVGHVLDLDHTTFGAGAANNLLTAGASRTIPTSTSNALTQLMAGTADQLLAAQLNQVLLSGFISPIPNIVTQVTDPTHVGDFSVNFENAGRLNELLKTLTLAAPTGTYLEYGTFKQLTEPGDTSGISATPSFSNCTKFGKTKGCQTIELSFTGTPFVFGDNFDYTISVCQSDGWGVEFECKTVPLSDLSEALSGGTYTYQFSDGYQTTSLLSGDTVLSANSWGPDPSIPSQIYNPALLFEANMGQLPCTPADGSCPLELNLEDGSPIDEGTLVPEPSSLLLLSTALLLLPVGSVTARGRGRARARPLFEAGLA